MLNAQTLVAAVATLREVWDLPSGARLDMATKLRALEAACNIEVALRLIKVPIVAAPAPAAELMDPQLLV